MSIVSYLFLSVLNVFEIRFLADFLSVFFLSLLCMVSYSLLFSVCWAKRERKRMAHGQSVVKTL